MLEKEFDKFVTDRFKDHQSPVPDDMWNRIKGVEDNDRKAFFFWKWYYNVPIVLVICLLIAYFMFAYYMLHPADKMKDRHETGLRTKEQVVIDSGRQGGRNQSDPVAGGLPAGEKGGVDDGKKVGDKDVAGKKMSAGKLKRIGAGGKGNANFVDKPLTGRKKAMRPGMPDPVSDKDNDSGGDGVLKQSEEKNAGLQKDGRAINGGKGVALQKDSTQVKNQQALKSIKSGKDSLTKKITSRRNDEPPKADKKGLLHDKPWYIEVYASPDLPFTTERAWLSYSGGGRLSRMLTRNFSASIGLQYSRINLYLKERKGDSMNPFNPFAATQFRNFDIPFLIGYERGNAHFRAILHAGLIYNVHTCPDGEHYRPGFADYRKSTGISLYMGLGLMGRLNERISLFTEPYFRLQLSNRGSPTLPFSQRLDVGGLNLGLRFDLRKGGRK